MLMNLSLTVEALVELAKRAYELCSQVEGNHIPRSTVIVNERSLQAVTEPSALLPPKSLLLLPPFNTIEFNATTTTTTLNMASNYLIQRCH